VFHSLFTLWFQLVHDWGYAGVFTLMAIESTVFPLPSEVVMPPAAYWAAQGRMTFWGVVAAGTLGSWVGSALSYLAARSLGRPLILRFGRYVFVPEKKWIMAEQWIQRYGGPGIFFARLLPVVRHLVSLPAGAARMNFRVFSLMTLLGSFSWCWVLTWFGARVLADQPNLMQDPEALAHVIKDKLLWFVIAVVLMAGLYALVEFMGRRLRREAAASSDAAEG
jgi:membrane protein DedA with SNARE-associated domain